jgi:nicotinamidase-related amidase
MLTFDELITRKTARIDETHRYAVDRTALLVIDMQRSFMDPKSSLYVPTSWDILPPTKVMVNFCRTSKIPVVFTEFVASPEIPNLRKDPFGPEHLVAEPGQPAGWGWPSSNSVLGVQGPESPATIDELKPLPGEPVIHGYTLDKFYGTPLDLVLRSLDIRYVMITGMMADLCVAATLFSAAMRDYRVTALTDCITTIWPNILEACFDIFGRKLARLQTSDQALQELETQLSGDVVKTAV